MVVMRHHRSMWVKVKPVNWAILALDARIQKYGLLPSSSQPLYGRRKGFSIGIQCLECHHGVLVYVDAPPLSYPGTDFFNRRPEGDLI